MEPSRHRPARLFAAAARPGSEHELAEMNLEVVARPGMITPSYTPGLIALHRGEGNLAVISAVERVAPSRAVLEAEGIPCEGYADGVFIEVDGGPSGRRGLRIAGVDQRLKPNVVLLRERGPQQRARPGPTAPHAPSEDTEPTPLATLLAAVYALRRRRQRTVREEYLRSVLEPESGTSPIADDRRRAVDELQGRQTVIAASWDRAALSTIVDDLTSGLLASAERAFILDPQRSSLELLEPADRDRYLAFAWHAGDFPGGPPGPNEARAERMFAALTRLRPERRANSGATAAVSRDEFDAAMQRRLDAALAAVPGERGQRLHRDASAAYVDMRTAAAAEGVTLNINNSYRSAERAQANAASASNSSAVASFSSHTLGLAVDLNMSHSGLRFTETGTRPFRNLVDMYKSPVHKWMFLRGETYGWFPYGREPWHWEYNPPGLRERLRQQPPAASSTAPAEAAGFAEAFTDPIPPMRPPLAITAPVGRGAPNNAADVRAVQDRLIELRVIDAADLASERPAAAAPVAPPAAAAPGARPVTGAPVARPAAVAPVAEPALPQTIEAIERFQRQMGIDVDGTVPLRGVTRTDLDRAIPVPTPTELSAIATELGTITQSISRGLTITGPVGATATGNAVDDVRAVQRRLVELHHLGSTHREAPAAGATGTVTQSNLSETIAALRRFQNEVRFFVSKGTIAGAVTAGVIAPGDATAALLDRISVYSMALGSNRLSLRDHVRSSVAQSVAGVAFAGTASPSALPLSAYTHAGLSAGQAAALKLVSTFEGNFDAINTYDRAIVSTGFIQFAGGRGLPPYIALLKARQAAKFRDQLQKFGIDVEFTVSGNAITGSRIVVLDPAGTRVLRGTAAETAIRDDKRLTTALILSGRDRDVQAMQIEAAVRGYVMPALNASMTPSTSTRVGRPQLRQIIRSQKGMAALFDRAIQEGLGAASRRFERLIQRLVGVAERVLLAAPPTPPPQPVPSSLPALQSREGDVLAELERDLQAAADVAANLARARTLLQTVVDAARAAGATVAALMAQPALADAGRAVTNARAALADVVNVSGADVDAQLRTMTTTLTAEESRLGLTPAPASVGELTTALTASGQALATVAGPVSTAPMFLARVQRIRRSTLDAGLTEGV